MFVYCLLLPFGVIFLFQKMMRPLRLGGDTDGLILIGGSFLLGWGSAAVLVVLGIVGAVLRASKTSLPGSGRAGTASPERIQPAPAKAWGSARSVFGSWSVALPLIGGLVCVLAYSLFDLGIAGDDVNWTLFVFIMLLALMGGLILAGIAAKRRESLPLVCLGTAVNCLLLPVFAYLAWAIFR